MRPSPTETENLVSPLQRGHRAQTGARMTLPAEIIERARSVPIELVINQRGIKLSGKIEKCGPCPKCGGEDRFSINTKKNLWNCRQCGVGGDVIALVEHLDSVDFIGACTTLTGEPAPKANGRGNASKVTAKKIVTAMFEYCDGKGNIVYVIERVEHQNADGTFVLTRTESVRRHSDSAGPIPNIRASGCGMSMAFRSCRTGSRS